MLGDAARVAPQRGVGLRRAVAADHLVRLVAVGEHAQVREDIEHAGIDGVYVAGPKIPQQLIDARELADLVLPVLKVDRREPLAGMRVHER